MRDVQCDHHPPRFDLDPVAIALINDLVMEFDKSSDPRVLTYILSLSAVDKVCRPLLSTAQRTDAVK